MKTLQQIISEHPVSLQGVSPVCHGDYVVKRCPFPQAIRVDGLDGVKHNMTVPCGKCLYCLENKSFEWFSRYLSEQSVSKYTYFVTLTYDDANVHLLTIRDAQLLFKRLRVAGLDFKYSLVGEYGPRTVRPHFHFLLFIKNIPDGLDISNSFLFSKYLDFYWKKGIVDVVSPTDNHLKYLSKYLGKFFNDTYTVRSQSKGLGFSSDFMDVVFDHYLETSERVFDDTSSGSVIVPRTIIRKYRESNNFLPSYDLLPLEKDQKLLERYMYDLQTSYENYKLRKL